MTLASKLTLASSAAGIDRSAPGAILAVISDAHNTHCLNEAMLDTWFLSLSPERKAELYELDMEGDIHDAQPGVLGFLSTEVGCGFPEPAAESLALLDRRGREVMERMHLIRSAPLQPVSQEARHADL